jgi:hypothetical protein
LGTALAEVQQQRIENGKRSAHNILDELAETFEDVWRLRQRVRKQLDEDASFDPVPLRLLCDAIAQARATCQVAVNINHLAIEGERLRMEKEAKQEGQEDVLRGIFQEVLGPTAEEDMAEAFDGMLDAETARKLAEYAAPRLAERMIERLKEG